MIIGLGEEAVEKTQYKKCSQFQKKIILNSVFLIPNLC